MVSSRCSGSVAWLLVLVILAFPVVQGLPRDSTRTGPATPAGASPPQTIVLQPDAANGTDTSIVAATPWRNYGDNGSLWVGQDANGSLARSLLRFDLGSLPPNASIVNATLGLYQEAGGAGAVDVRRATAPWTEGSGGGTWTTIPVTVRETAGVSRTLEPLGVSLSFPPNSTADPLRALRVFSGGTEVPSQVSRITYVGGEVSSALVYFGVSIGPWGTRDFTVVYSTNGTGVPAYRMRGMGSAPLWTSPSVGSGASGVSVADLDGDGQLDILYGTSDGWVYDLSPTGSPRRAVRLSTGRSVPFTPQVADLDGDGRMDVIVLTNDPSVVRLNDTLGVVWTAAIRSPDFPQTTPTLVDVNGDGVLDILVGGKNKEVDAFNGTDGSIIRRYTAGDWTYTSSVLDLDRDGRGEIFFASDDSLVHAYRSDQTPLWANSTTSQFIETSVAIGDVNGDGVPDIVTGDDKAPGPEFALNATNGAVVWSTPLPGYREGGQTIADVNGDGIPEVLVGITTGPLYALRGTDGTILWTYSGGTTQPVSPAVVDVDNDGIPEILYMDRGSLVRVLNATGSLVHSWTIVPNDPNLWGLSQKAMATPAVLDLDGDGTMEVVVPTGIGVQAFGTGGLSRDWRTYGYNWNHTHRGGDGTSPDGAPPLAYALGTPISYPAVGASWEFRDGAARWLSPGGDFGAVETASPSASGWAAWNVTGMVADWAAGTFPNVGLFLTEPPAPAVPHSFDSSDAADPLRFPRLTITYTVPIVDPAPRILAPIPDLVLVEDGPPATRNLASYAADDDTPLGALRWNVSGVDPRILQITGMNAPGSHVLTFYPEKDANGAMRVTYWLTDPQGHTSASPAWVNVTPVNDPPEFDPPPTLVVKYNKTYTFNFSPYISDVDDPQSGLVFLSDDLSHATVSGFNVSFLYPQSYLGKWAFVGLVVSDGRASVGKVVAVKVTSDDPPVLIRDLPDVTMLEGETRRGVFDLDDYFIDANNDSLFFSFGYSHLTITIQANHSVDIIAESEWNGVEQVTFRGVDPQGAIAEDAILVTVLAVDDPPVLGPVPDLRVRYDANYSFNLEPYISDPDTPLDQITASAASPYATVSLHLLTLRYPFSLNGTVQNLTISISDGTISASRTIRVTVGDDWPPDLTAKLPDRTFLEDTAYPDAYNLSASFTDVDSTALYFSSGNRNVLVSIDPTGRVDLRASRDWFGTERVTFRATDALGALAEDTVWITVLPVDDAPYFTPIPEVRLNVTAAFLDLRPYLFDTDTNVSDLILLTSSSHATVVGLGLLLNYSGGGVDDIEVLVSDGSLSNRTTVHIVVALPGATEVVPGYLLWIPAPILAAGLAAFILYRRRQVEWALLVTNSGLLVSSVFRRNATAFDTDLISGMLTAIMNFAKTSFSDEKERELEELTLGDRRVTVVRGTLAFLAVVYSGRAPGSLPKITKSLLNRLESSYPEAFEAIVDSSKALQIPKMLKRFVDYAWWPLLRFEN